MRFLLRRIRNNPVRILLTALQIALASFAITLSLSAYLTPRQAAADDTFYLVAGQQGENTAQFYNVFNPADVEELARVAPDVEALGVYEYAFSPELSYDGRRYQFRTGATVSPEYFGLVELEMLEGSTFSTAEAESEEAVVLISAAAAKRIFGDLEPLGQDLLKTSVTGNTIPYRVVGVFADATNEFTSDVPAVYFPVWAAADTLNSTPTFAASELIVRAGPGRSEAAGEQLLTAVRRKYRKHPQLAGVEPGRDFYLTAQNKFVSSTPPFNPNLIILGLFGIVTLIVGSIGVFSSTLVSLAQRSYEIGIKRALGATGWTIGNEFGLETLALSLLSSVLGSVLAALLIPPLFGLLGNSFFLGVTVSWQPLAALIAVGATALSAVFLGVGPAYRMGRLEPIVNLQE